MPTYDYKCSCGYTEEIFHSMTDDTIHKCPECTLAMDKQISGGCGVIFKGSGFYHTDYKIPQSQKEENHKIHRAQQKLQNMETKGQIGPVGTDLVTMKDIGNL